MFFEVFIPAQTDGFDVTITVEAENWMLALKSGLERTGEGGDIRNVMCDIKDDNTIHVTDASTRRVFVLREMSDADDVSDDPEANFETQKMSALPEHLPTASAPPPASRDAAPFDRTDTPTRNQFRAPADDPKPAPASSPAPTPQAVSAAKQAISPIEPAKSEAPTPVELTRVARPEPATAQPKSAESAANETWTSDDGRMRIGSSTFEALRSEEPEPKVVRETRAPSGQRDAVDIGRATESVSQSALEEVFLEIQQIHEQQMSMEQVINFVMDLCMSKIKAEAGSIMFADVNGQELYFATARGPKAHDVMDFRVPMGVGIVGFCAREGVSLAISDAEKDPRFYKAISEALGYETQNLCCAPVQFEGRVYGCIELMNKDKPFSHTEVNVLTYVGGQLAKFVHDLIMAREKL